MKKFLASLFCCCMLFSGCSAASANDTNTAKDTDKVKETSKKDTDKTKETSKKDTKKDDDKKSDEDKKSDDKTSTDPVNHDSLDEFVDEIKDNKVLYEDGIQQFEDEKDKGTYVIPGLIQTETLLKGKKSICKEMTPQGIVATEDYLLVSAYCHEHKHNSVVYMIDKDTHEYVKTIVIDGKDHLGGLAYNPDTKMVWLATHTDGVSSASSIDLEDMENYSLAKDEKALPFDHVVKTSSLREDSFLTYKDNSLYLGTFTKEGDSVVEQFDITDPGEISDKPDKRDEISDSAQGIAFYKDYILISDSDGHVNSKLRAFKTSDKKLLDSDEVTNFTLPERLEQIAVDGDDAYIIFESAANAYSAGDAVKIDRIVKVDLSKLKF